MSSKLLKFAFILANAGNQFLDPGSSPKAVDLRDFHLPTPSPRRRPGSRED